MGTSLSFNSKPTTVERLRDEMLCIIVAPNQSDPDLVYWQWLYKLRSSYLQRIEMCFQLTFIARELLVYYYCIHCVPKKRARFNFL